MLLHGNNGENKELYPLFCQVKVCPVTQSFRSFIFINVNPVRALRKCLPQNKHSNKCTKITSTWIPFALFMEVQLTNYWNWKHVIVSSNIRCFESKVKDMLNRKKYFNKTVTVCGLLGMEWRWRLTWTDVRFPAGIIIPDRPWISWSMNTLLRAQNRWFRQTGSGTTAGYSRPSWNQQVEL